MSFFEELKRRNVFRVGIGYLITAWLLLQVIDVVMPIMAVPDWVPRVILLLLAVGFIPALIFAWAFELTPDGLKRDRDVDRNQSVAQQTGRKLDRAIMFVMAIALAWFAWDKFAGSAPKPPAEAAARPVEAAMPAAQTPESTQKSIAVLPFVNMSADPDQEYFSDGLAEELLNRLAKINDLRVAARTSSFQFKGQNLDVADIGRQLKVDNVLEGSVRKSGNRLRITAQLISAAEGYHLWSETYERELDDVFAIQDDISTAITQALEVELGTSGKALSATPERNLEAYNIYLQARYFLARRGGDNMLQAARLFKQATDMEPGFTDAWSGLAFTAALFPNYTAEFSSQEALEQCLEAAENAFESDPDNPEALVARGRVRSTIQWDWAGAQEDFERALAAAPNDINTLNFFGDFLTQTGDFSRAEQIKKRLATELDPLSPIHANDLNMHYSIRGMYPEALDYARRAVSLDPSNDIRKDGLIWALMNLGQWEEARDLMHQYAKTGSGIPGGNLTWAVNDAYLNADIPKIRSTLTALIELEQAQKQPYWNTSIAFYTLWLDGPRAAIPWLKRAYQAREYGIAWPDPFFRPDLLSDDPEWQAFWRQPGLAELIDLRRTNSPGYTANYNWRERPEQP